MSVVQPDRKVHGYFVVRSLYAREEIERVPVYHERNSREAEAIERQMVQSVDLNRRYFTWEDADAD